MPRVEIEFDDAGNVVGEAPAPFLAHIERETIKAHGTGYKNGVSETKTSTAKQFEETLKAELAKKDALSPMERAKFAQMEEETKSINARFTQAITDHTKTLRDQEEAHARKTLSLSDAVSARNTRISALVGEQLEGLAMSSGAREESLPELRLILSNYVGFTEEMEPFIKGEDGQPRRMANGQPVTLKAFVKDYIDTHSHHRAPVKGAGGGARGGATFRGVGDTPSADSAKKRIDSGDRSAGAINELFEATRKRAG